MKVKSIFILTLLTIGFAMKVNAQSNEFYSEKKLGAFYEDGKIMFRLFAPNAYKVLLYVSDKPDFEKGDFYEMKKDKDGVWEFSLKEKKDKFFYGFKVWQKDINKPSDNPHIAIDPYSKAVATFNDYMNPRLSVFVENSDFDWGDDTWIKRNPLDYIIYEMHVRDMTAHESSGAKHCGTYSGLTEKGIRGGIDYIKSLGVNAVELLPSQEFGNMEIPYKKKFEGKFNDWNPYERNHWGYMTACYFAPEAYYAQNWTNFKRNVWMGTDASQINKFKEMVKAFHKENIAVIMDVVYNHLSEYELGNLKQIDKKYYFRLDEKGDFIAQSYCGNDLATEKPMVRRLIVESVLYWMKEYHIDGFRFDLAKLIDWGTIDAITKAAKKVNPNVLLIAEPWGGGYDPAGFSKHGWAAWNDQIRNGVKGQNPRDGLGWIFGKWFDNNSKERLLSYLRGTLVKDKFGLFKTPAHSVNYLESHDDNTLGDFIRLGTRAVKENQKISDLKANATVRGEQLKLNKLAALFLFVSRGIVMIHEGQEFARSKVIVPQGGVDDPKVFTIDRNSYNKDNETNYINYDYADLNKELVDYYKGLIRLRKTFPAFRRAKYDDVTPCDIEGSEFALVVRINYKEDTFLIALNGDSEREAKIDLGNNKWNVLVSPEKVTLDNPSEISGKLKIPHSSGYILKLTPQDAN